MSGLEILGATASALQIVGHIYNLSVRIFEKSKDANTLAAILTDIQKYFDRFKQ